MQRTLIDGLLQPEVGLKAKSELNGKVGLLVEWDEAGVLWQKRGVEQNEKIAP